MIGSFLDSLLGRRQRHCRVYTTDSNDTAIILSVPVASQDLLSHRLKVQSGQEFEFDFNRYSGAPTAPAASPTSFERSMQRGTPKPTATATRGRPPY